MDDPIDLGPSGMRLAEIGALQERVRVLEAHIAKAKDALNSIDALDPERGAIHGMSESAVKGLVLRMGEIARTALSELAAADAELLEPLP